MIEAQPNHVLAAKVLPTPLIRLAFFMQAKVGHFGNLKQAGRTVKGGFGSEANWNDPTPEMIDEIERRKSEVQAAAIADHESKGKAIAERALQLRAEGLTWKQIRRIVSVPESHLQTLVETYGSQEGLSLPKNDRELD